MIRPRWRKIMRDIWRNKRRTILVILSIAVGVFAVGTVAHMRVIVTDDMVESYEAANPPSAILYTTEAFDDAMVKAVRRIPGVAEAEARRVVIVRFRHPQSDTWYGIRLYAVPDYEAMRIGILRRELAYGPDPARWPNPGIYPPPDRQILVERTSALLTNQGLAPDARQGDTVLIETPGGTNRPMRLAGMVYDSVHGAAPFTGMAYGYITLDTLEWLGVPRTYTELHILASGDRHDVAHIEEVANRVEHRLKKSGLDVSRVDIPTPGKLPQDGIFQALVLLLTALGVASLFLSVFLLISTVSALLNQQVRQIGVMKAIGGRSGQIARLYLGMVAFFGVAALAIAAPLSAWAARYILNFLTYLVDFTLGEFSIPSQVFLLEAALAILVPLLAGLVPILSGTRISVREAIGSYGLSAAFGRSWFDRLLQAIRVLPAPAALSVRNTFRNKGRLMLTLITLSLAGAIFMAVVNVRTSLLQTIDDLVRYLNSDITVTFNQPYRLGRLEPLAKSVPGVEAVEGWGAAGAYRIRPDGSEGEDIYLEAPPAGSTMINPTVVQGRWLLPGDENALVVSASLLTDEPDLRVGGPLTLDINGEEATWNIVGAVRIARPVPLAYTNYDYLASLIGGTGRVSTLDITTDRHDPAYRTQVAEALEAVFTDAGLNVGGVQTISQIRAGIEVLFNIIITLLMSMVILLAIVGAIGLAGTMSLNVLERIREIGVLRAIGASNGAVLQVVIVEGVLIGMLSWAIGALLALPVGKVIANAIGKVTLNADVSYTVSIAGIFLWLAIVTVISAVASFFPAQQAADLSVREVLAYEQ